MISIKSFTLDRAPVQRLPFGIKNKQWFTFTAAL